MSIEQRARQKVYNQFDDWKKVFLIRLLRPIYLLKKNPLQRGWWDVLLAVSLRLWQAQHLPPLISRFRNQRNAILGRVIFSQVFR